jgi:hypothetical protein
MSTICYKLTFRSYYELYLTVQLAWHYICKFSIDFVCSFVSKMILQTILGTISSKMATLKFSRDKRFIPKNQRCQQKLLLPKNHQGTHNLPAMVAETGPLEDFYSKLQAPD